MGYCYLHPISWDLYVSNYHFVFSTLLDSILDLCYQKISVKIKYMPTVFFRHQYTQCGAVLM